MHFYTFTKTFYIINGYILIYMLASIHDNLSLYEKALCTGVDLVEWLT